MKSAIVEPLLLFCAHAIRMHDGRCCGVVLRVFRSIIPDFQVLESAPEARSLAQQNANVAFDQQPAETATPSPNARRLDPFPVPQATADAVREFISSDVLKACISSLHEPYFVELQKELGSLIAAIILYYCPLTTTPRDILLTLPNIKQEDVDLTIECISRPGLHTRQQRALVLDLLQDLKGVSISEMGKLNKTAGLGTEGTRSGKKTLRSKMVQEFMTAPGSSPAGQAVVDAGDAGAQGAADRRQSPDLDGITGLFNAGI